MALSLSSLRTAVANDPGLLDNVSLAQLTKGLTAVDTLSQILIQVLESSHLNDDGLISEADMQAVSDAVRANTTLRNRFMKAHGDDEGSIETGYHLLQNDGGSLLFQGLNLVDTVVDAIFHFGFKYEDGHFLNEDGNANEDVADVAGWLNYFLNGVNVVHGTDTADELYSGAYSAAMADAANETWYAGAGNDSVWADQGDDTVWAGAGDDKSGGGYGNDKMYGEGGDDTLWGEQGHDRIDGGVGADVIGAGTGRDTVHGGSGDDEIYGESGNDVLNGEAGNDLIYAGVEDDTVNGGSGADTLVGEAGDDLILGCGGADELHGCEGGDRLKGGDGDDYLSGGDGIDVLDGGAGADSFALWESTTSRDTLVFHAGDSGKTLATIDHVEGFVSGEDKIDLRAFAGMSFEELDYTGGGQASCYFDGRYLRVDGNGDAASDMIIEFRWQDQLTVGDFLFA